MVFGTSSLLGPDPQLEEDASRYVQDAWDAFAKDPVKAHIVLMAGWCMQRKDRRSCSWGWKAVFGSADKVDGTRE